MRVHTHAPTSHGVHANAFSLEANNVVSNQFGVSMLLEAWITLCELYGTILFIYCLCFYLFKKAPIFFVCLEECYNAVLL